MPFHLWLPPWHLEPSLVCQYHPHRWEVTFTQLHYAESLLFLMTGLLSFMLERSPTLGSVETSDYEKKQFALRQVDILLCFTLIKSPNWTHSPWAGALSSTWNQEFSMNCSLNWEKRQKKRWRRTVKMMMMMMITDHYVFHWSWIEEIGNFYRQYHSSSSGCGQAWTSVFNLTASLS